MANGIKIQVLNVVAAVAACCSSVMADDRAKLTSVDQPCVVFKAIEGSKYPGMTIIDPAAFQMQIVLGGCEKNGEIGLVKTPEDLTTLVPLRYTLKNADAGVQIDKKYEGCREAYVGVALEYLFKAIGLMPADGYQGTMLVDEYKAGLPMKWVLGSMDKLHAIKDYMIRKFAEKGIKPLAQKPLLLIEILNGDTNYSASDLEFLNAYFDVLDRNDAKVKAFFDKIQETTSDILDKTKDAKNVLESMGELLMRKMEAASGDFEAKKVVAILLGFVVGGVLLKVVTDHISEFVVPKKQGPKSATSEDLAKLGDRLEAALASHKPVASPA